MIWPLIKLDLRKALPVHLATTAVLVGIILITPDILDIANVFFLVVAMAQGWLLAWRIFRDTNSTQSFVFSRPWSRGRIFWNRWALGVICQGVTVLLIYVLLAAGTRTLIHERNVPYFPMVERFELSILWPIAIAPAISFHIIMFLMLRSPVVNPGAAGGKWQAYVVKAALALILMTFIGMGKAVDVAEPADAGLRVGYLALVYAAVLAVLCTAASLNCYKNMEIES